jgi:DNA-binding CsgD family transcriptional regulator
MDSFERFYSLDELAGELNLGVNTASEYLKNNKFSNTLKMHKGGWHILQKDVIDFKQTDKRYKKVKETMDILEKNKGKYLSISQSAETLNKSEQTVKKYIENKNFPNILSLPLNKRIYYIPISDLEEFLNKSKKIVRMREAAK